MKQYDILDLVNSPDDLKKLPWSSLPQLCEDIRNYIINTVSQNGGHLASNLGVVELTVALHLVFSTPLDEIVWDVGHQCYTHKILTGRKDRFNTLRKQGGISGFPKQAESEHDAFVAGHAGTSISVATGIARGKSLSGDDHHTIAVIGDGAFTNGLAYEGLTSSALLGDNLIIILNDNDMSISSNVGAFAHYLAKIRSSASYFKAKDVIEETLDSVPIVGTALKISISKAKTIAKNMLYNSNLFEDLGFDYLGPVNGHDLESLVDVLTRAKELNRPCFIHIETQKGRGYEHAKSNPSMYHGVSKFCIESGITNYKPASGFSEEFGKYITYLALNDEKICAITAAMTDSTGLKPFAKRFKEQGRFFDVEIAEEHGVAFAGGLATKGFRPIFAVYSTFLQRSYDQIIHDLSIEPKHVVLAVDRAGIVGDDGETHQGVFDVAMLSTIPGMTIYSPANYKGLRYSLHKALYKHKGVVAVRYPRGAENLQYQEFMAQDNDNKLTHCSTANLIITYGRLITQAAEATEILKHNNKQVSVLHLNKIYPIADTLFEQIKEYENILFVEEGVKKGSVAEYFAAQLLQRGFNGKFKIKAIDNEFVPQASIEQAFVSVGFNANSIAKFFLGGLL